MMIHSDWLQPNWRLPGIGALMTTRAGGFGTGRFDSLNLRDGIGDDAPNLAANRSLLATAIGAAPVWLEQVHGARVLRLSSRDAQSNSAVRCADASVTTDSAIACTVMTADCLPVLFATTTGRAVGAAHAGWRGLAAGILEAALGAVCEAGDCEPHEVLVWLGACIGPRRFEVGRDVLDAFGASPLLGRQGGEPGDDRPRFVPHADGKWLANLPLLARDRLHAAGVRNVTGGSWCTVENPSRFFSFRRDGVTGRMAAAVWIAPGR